MQALNDSRVEAALLAYFDALTRRDKQAWLALLARNAILHEPVGALPAEHDEGREQVWQMLTGPFASLSVQAEQTFYGGSGAAVKWRARGQAAATSGAASTTPRRSITFEGISIFELDAEGKIQTVMSYWDPAEMLIRLADEGVAADH
ncbi:MAG TPA: nuclear transport factor 2 family protein [Candidatus Limnocylindrales bacterium]|nr:nuclear transport factor 2 family protein [Candidatus Limnocylindrales bacterium]